MGLRMTRDTLWIFSHTGINHGSMNIDVALEGQKRGMKVIVYGSAAESTGKKPVIPVERTYLNWPILWWIPARHLQMLPLQQEPF